MSDDTVMTDSPVEVTQADIESANRFLRECPLSVKMVLGQKPSIIKNAFARHRLASEQSSQAQIAAMREALERISRGGYDGLEVTHMSASACRYIARQALSTLGSQS